MDERENKILYVTFDVESESEIKISTSVRKFFTAATFVAEKHVF